MPETRLFPARATAGFFGGHSAMGNGKGKNITTTDLIQAASSVDIQKSFVAEAIQRAEEALAKFETLKTAVR